MQPENDPREAVKQKLVAKQDPLTHASSDFLRTGLIKKSKQQIPLVPV